MSEVTGSSSCPRNTEQRKLVTSAGDKAAGVDGTRGRKTPMSTRR